MKPARAAIPLLVLSVLLISSLSAGCCCPAFNQYQELKKLVPVGTVKGTVYAGNPKQPVPNARVVIADQVTTTDAQGTFRLDNVVATNQTIVVTSGDLRWSGTTNVTKDAEVTLPEIILESAAP